MNRLIAMGARIHAHTFMPLPQTFFAGMKPNQIGKGMEAIGGKWPKAVYGNWKEQRELSKKVSEYLRKNLRN